MAVSSVNVSWAQPASGSWLPGQVVHGVLEVSQDGAGNPTTVTRIEFPVFDDRGNPFPSAAVAFAVPALGVNSPYRTAANNSSTMTIPVSCTVLQSRVATLATDYGATGNRVYAVPPVVYTEAGEVVVDSGGGNTSITVSFPGA